MICTDDYKFANSKLCHKLQNLKFANIQTRENDQIYNMSVLTNFVFVRRQSLAVCHGQSTVIGRVLRVGITGNSVCLAAYH